MKRIISMTLVVLMIAALFAACGSSSPAGKYVVKSINGQTVEEAMKDQAEQSGINVDDMLKMLNIDNIEELITIELKSDGAAVMKSSLGGTELTGTWKQDGETVELTLDDQTQKFTFKNNELSASDGDQQYVFVKK